MADDLSLPVDKLHEWGAELRRLEGVVADATKQREEILAKIHAVRLIFGSESIPADVISQNEAGEDRITFTGYIEDLLASHEGGMTAADIAKRIADSPLAGRFQRNSNAVYNATTRLAERGVIVKRGRAFYAKAVFERLGDVYAEQAASPVPILIRDILTRAGKALTAGEIMDVLKRDETMKDRIDKNPQYGYSVLSRMTQRQQLLRRNGLYALPGQLQEIPQTQMFT